MVVSTITSNPKESLFDETPGYDEEANVRYPEGLTVAQRKQANELYHLFNELWGVCIVVGDPGTGKDVFLNYVSWLMKRYFPFKKIWRDEKPRPLYGEYVGLFNAEVIAEDLARMKSMATGVPISQYDEELEKAADMWVKDYGQIMLKDSIVCLTEFWQYVYNRDPHNPMNKTMGGLHKMKRHIGMLVIGNAQLVSDLDRYTCLPFVDWKVTCTRDRKTSFLDFIHKVKYDRRKETLVEIGRPYPFGFDAGKPRSDMGDGKIVLLRPDYLPETEEERVVMTVLKAGGEKYEDIVEVITDAGDMEEWEVLDTLKELKFRKSKRVITYPCIFHLFNSKSAPQLKTTLKSEG